MLIEKRIASSKSEKGIILLMSLFFLMIISLYALNLMQAAILQKKMGANFALEKNYVNALETAVTILQTKFTHNDIYGCVVKSTHRYLQNCTLMVNTIRFHYDFNYLAAPACQIYQNHSIEYYELNLRADSHRQLQNKELLVILSRPTDAKIRCFGSMREVQIGVQTWRET